MARKKKDRGEALTLYRAVKARIDVSPFQESLLNRISDGLREIINIANEERVVAYKTYKEARLSGIEKPDVHLPTWVDQVNVLTAQGKADKEAGLWRVNIYRNWKEQAIITLAGSYDSFYALAKNGDPDARPPRMRDPGYFCEIQGRSGFTVVDRCIPNPVTSQEIRESYVQFGTQKFGDSLTFNLPAYSADSIKGKKVKDFKIYRAPSDMRRPGKYFISLSYELPAPPAVPFHKDTAVYLGLGTTSIGVSIKHPEQKAVEFIIDLWRPDKHWMPRIDEVTKLRDKPTLTKGSKQWKAYNESRREMYRIMAEQQKLNQRQVVAHLLKYGTHFVVQDYIVRSKKGKLADGEKKERSGFLGLNWAAQNTGTIARFVMHLESKVAEHGGSVVKCRPTTMPPKGRGRENKIAMAERLRSDVALLPSLMTI